MSVVRTRRPRGDAADVDVPTLFPLRPLVRGGGRARQSVVGDRVQLTAVTKGGDQWGHYVGATGTVEEVRGSALIVLWDDPQLNGNDEAMSPTIIIDHLDRWKTIR